MKSLYEKFNERWIPEPNTGCWLWTHGSLVAGYGVIQDGNKSLKAHRVSYELFIGQIGKGLFVCHKCDTPACVNPNHLWLGTCKDNLRDAVKKKRMHEQKKTHCPNGHPYSGDNLIMHYRKNKNPTRECKKCNRERQRKLSGKRLNSPS